jgi:Arc/MetJ-type ribon-helix-helix transcriptional regulator
MKDRTTSRRRIQTSLPPEVLARIDALIVRFSKPGRRATQAEILRELVRLGLAELDATEGRGARPARKRRR